MKRVLCILLALALLVAVGVLLCSCDTDSMAGVESVELSNVAKIDFVLGERFDILSNIEISVNFGQGRGSVKIDGNNPNVKVYGFNTMKVGNFICTIEYGDFVQAFPYKVSLQSASLFSDTPPLSDGNSKATAYVINTVEDFENIAYVLEEAKLNNTIDGVHYEAAYTYKYFKLGSDIDFKGASISAIPFFVGYLDGNGHSLLNVGSGSFSGSNSLFDIVGGANSTRTFPFDTTAERSDYLYIKGGEAYRGVSYIKNLTVTFDSDKQCSFINNTIGEVILSNVRTSGTIKGDYAIYSSPFVCNAAKYANEKHCKTTICFKNCLNTTDIIAPSMYAGSFVGNADSEKVTLIFEICHNKGDITSDNASGFIGKKGDAQYSLVGNNSNTCVLSATKDADIFSCNVDEHRVTASAPFTTNVIYINKASGLLAIGEDVCIDSDNVASYGISRFVVVMTYINNNEPILYRSVTVSGEGVINSGFATEKVLESGEQITGDVTVTVYGINAKGAIVVYDEAQYS